MFGVDVCIGIAFMRHDSGVLYLYIIWTYFSVSVFYNSGIRHSDVWSGFGSGCWCGSVVCWFNTCASKIRLRQRRGIGARAAGIYRVSGCWLVDVIWICNRYDFFVVDVDLWHGCGYADVKTYWWTGKYSENIYGFGCLVWMWLSQRESRLTVVQHIHGAQIMHKPAWLMMQASDRGTRVENQSDFNIGRSEFFDTYLLMRKV